jgi:hypothetical protein
MAFFVPLLGFAKWLAGPLTKFFDYRTQRAVIEAGVRKESIQADIEFARIKKEVHEINQGWWATRWIVPGFAYPLIIWWNAVILDSIYQFPTWDVAKLPAPLDEWAGQIILSFFIVRTVEVGVNAIGRGNVISMIADTARSIFRPNSKK